jgi:hypothetical protein
MSIFPTSNVWPGMLAAMFFLVTGCATNVSVDYDESALFSSIKTYSLLPKAPASTEDKRLSSPLVDQRIVKAIKSNMAKKGYRYDETSPDVKLQFQIDLKQEVASDGSGMTMMIGSGFGHSGFGVAYGIGSDVRTYERGRLTIDVLSADNEKLLWRGTNSRRIYEPSTPESSEELVNEVVGEILEKFPPGS